MIGLNRISQISETVAAVRCVVLFEAEVHFGVPPGFLATVNLLAWSKVFHVKFYLLSDGFRTLSC